MKTPFLALCLVGCLAHAQTPTADAVKALQLLEARADAGISYADFSALVGQTNAALASLNDPALAERIATLKKRESTTLSAWRARVEMGVSIAQHGHGPLEEAIITEAAKVPGAEAAEVDEAGIKGIQVEALVRLLMADVAKQSAELRTAIAAR